MNQANRGRKGPVDNSVRKPLPAYTLAIYWCVSLSQPLFAGCKGGNARVEAPEVDANEVAQRLIDEYDADGDGSISSSEEIKACPALAENFSAYDQNSDSNLSLQELRDRLASIYSDRVAFYPLYAQVTLNGRPLRGAQVMLSPEPAFGDAIHVADGDTDRNGFAVLTIAESDMPPELQGVLKCVQTGLYRIHVKHDSKSLPEEVVAGDRFGAEVTSKDGNSGIKLAIKSR